MGVLALSRVSGLDGRSRGMEHGRQSSSDSDPACLRRIACGCAREARGSPSSATPGIPGRSNSCARWFPLQTRPFQPGPLPERRQNQPSQRNRGEAWWCTNMAKLSLRCRRMKMKALLAAKLLRVSVNQLPLNQVPLNQVPLNQASCNPARFKKQLRGRMTNRSRRLQLHPP